MLSLVSQTMKDGSETVRTIYMVQNIPNRSKTVRYVHFMVQLFTLNVMKWILELSSWLNPAREKLGDVQIAPREFFLQMINLSQNQLQKYSRHYSLAWVLWRERFEDTVKDDFWNLICQEVSENPDSTMCNFSAQLPFLFNVNFSFFCKYKDFTADNRYFWPRVFLLQPGYPYFNVLNLQIWAIFK